MARITTFGSVIVTEIRTPNNLSTTTVNVVLEQEQIDTYTPDNTVGENTPKNLQLATLMGAYADKLEPKVWTSKRRITQNVPVGTVEEGHVFDNLHIQRVRWTTPQWEGHTAAADGKYYTTNLCEGFVDDINGVEEKVVTSATVPASSVFVEEVEATV